MASKIDLNQPGYTAQELLSLIPEVLEKCEDYDTVKKVKCLVCNTSISVKTTSSNLVNHLKSPRHLKKETAITLNVSPHHQHLVNKYPEIFAYEGHEAIKCNVCQTVLRGKNIDAKGHLTSQFHEQSRKIKVRQQALEKMSNAQFNKMVVLQAIRSGLSLHQLESIRKGFLEGIAGRHLPSESTARRILEEQVAPEINDMVLTQLRQPGAKISIAIDEMTDAQGRMLVAVLVGTIELQGPNEIYFYKLEDLSALRSTGETLANVVQKVVLEIWPNGNFFITI